MSGSVHSALTGLLAKQHRAEAEHDAFLLSLGQRLARTLTFRFAQGRRYYVAVEELRPLVLGAGPDAVIELERRSASYVAPVRAIAVEDVLGLLERAHEAEGGTCDRRHQGKALAGALNRGPGRP